MEAFKLKYTSVCGCAALYHEAMMQWHSLHTLSLCIASTHIPEFSEHKIIAYQFLSRLLGPGHRLCTRMLLALAHHQFPDG